MQCQVPELQHYVRHLNVLLEGLQPVRAHGTIHNAVVA